MVSDDMKRQLIPMIFKVIESMSKFGPLTLHDSPKVPYYHGYLGTMTNGITYLLYLPILLADAGGIQVPKGGISDEHWQTLIKFINRIFYVYLAGVLEMMCLCFCKSMNKTVKVHKIEFPSEFIDFINNALNDSAIDKNKKQEWFRSLKKINKNSEKIPEFMDYIESALSCSKMPDSRKTEWRKYFKGMRIIRNKAAHGEAILNEKEKQILIEAGMKDYIETDPQNTIIGTYYWFEPMVDNALKFIKELEATAVPQSSTV